MITSYFSLHCSSFLWKFYLFLLAFSLLDWPVPILYLPVGVICVLFSVFRTFRCCELECYLHPTVYYWCFDLFTVSLVILKFNFCQFCVILHNHFYLCRVIFIIFGDWGLYFAWKVSPDHHGFVNIFLNCLLIILYWTFLILRSFIVLEFVSLWYSRPVLFQKKSNYAMLFIKANKHFPLNWVL